MHRRLGLDRWMKAGSFGVALALVAPHARAETTRSKDKAACVASYQSAQEQVRSGHLREASRIFASCAVSICGSLLQECTNRYTQLVDTDIPSIVPSVVDESGAPKVDVQVKSDGDLLTSHLDGQPLPLDPGLHEFTFGNEHGVFATKKILIVQGQRNRPITVSMRSGEAPAPAPGEPTPAPSATEKAAPAAAAPSSDGAPTAAPAAPPEEPPPPPGPSRLPQVLGAFGGAAIAGGVAGAVIYSSWGTKDGLFLASDVTLGVAVGVGATALGFAAWSFAAGNAKPDEHAAQTRLHFGVTPAPSGAFASIAGAF